MTEFDPALVEKAARALHLDRCCPCDPNGCDSPDALEYIAAQVILSAVATDLRTEGARRVAAAVDRTSSSARTIAAAHEAVVRIEGGA